MIPEKYGEMYLPVKFFLNSYRALSDGKTALRLLQYQMNNNSILLSEWKVNWIAACTLLRSSIDLFRQDKASCLSVELREGIEAEWVHIKTNKEKHPIYWEFLKKERDNIIHEYKWNAYEVWMKDCGEYQNAHLNLLDIKPQDMRSVLLMRSGTFKGRNSVELLNEGATWVEERIFGAIKRAGFTPEEERSLATFAKRSPIPPSLLGKGPIS